MTPLTAAILGLVQGLTEFLPVSSSGHLVLAGAILGVPEGSLSFDIVLHLGSLTAVLAIYSRDISELLSGIFARRREDLALAGFLVLGSVPAGLAGFLLADRIESLFNSPPVVSAMLLFTGCVLFATRFVRAGQRQDPAPLGSLVIGLFQAIALVPGISRSGMTISAGLFAGVRRERAARFSFLLSVPAILGAALLDLTGSAGIGSLDFPVAAVGFVVSSITGYFALRLLIRFLVAGRFHFFGWYCWIVGGLGLALTLGKG
jgi:undecaprenyl-diphosphatase